MDISILMLLNVNERKAPEISASHGKCKKKVV
jgi:hypothetical protein